MDDLEGKERAKEREDLVSEAAEGVAQQETAELEARARPRPDRSRLVLPLSVVFLGIVMWDAYTITRPPRALPPIEQEADLRQYVAEIADAVDMFLVSEGRLPGLEEIAHLLGPAISYQLQGNDYVVTAEAGGVRITYDRSVSLDEWVLLRTTADGEGDP